MNTSRLTKKHSSLKFVLSAHHLIDLLLHSKSLPDMRFPNAAAPPAPSSAPLRVFIIQQHCITFDFTPLPSIFSKSSSPPPPLLSDAYHTLLFAINIPSSNSPYTHLHHRLPVYLGWLNTPGIFLCCKIFHCLLLSCLSLPALCA